MHMGTVSRGLFSLSSIWLISTGIYEMSGQTAKSKSWIGNTELVQMIVASNGTLKVGLGVSMLALSAMRLSEVSTNSSIKTRDKEQE